MTSRDLLSAEILGQIALMQSVVAQLPDRQSMLSFACRGLMDVSGVAEAVCFPVDSQDNMSPAEIEPTLEKRVFPISRNNRTHATITLHLNDAKAFHPYTPYIENFCSMLAVVFEERSQREENRLLLENLEQRVAERTAELENEIQERRKTETLLLYANSLTSAAMESSPDGILVVQRNGEIARWNQRFVDLWQVPEQLLRAKVDEPILKHVTDQMAQPEDFLAKVQELYGHPESSSEDVLTLADGRVFERFSQPVRINEEIVGRLWSFRDISGRKKAENALKESEAKFKAMANTSPLAIYMSSSLEQKAEYINPTFTKLFGYTIEDVPSIAEWLPLAYPDEHYRNRLSSEWQKKVELAIKTSSAIEPMESIVTCKDGSKKNISWGYISTGVQNWAFGLDLTGHRRAEAEKSKLLAQLHQAQKMEAIGQLAGGVAHDFNNMLGVILGHTEMVMDEIDPSQAIFSDLEQIQTAAKRSADITRQLLAFARKQTIAPKVIDLNETIESVLKMLRRLIGENIDLAWLPFGRLWPVKMDPSQIDQILANLCINARGAITGTGKITVETGNSTFDQEYCTLHTDALPGDFVHLTVSDNGCGMSKETMDHIFEPFFTTKNVGEGTGLGLATVYGAIRQNNGFINVYSEPGRGTTFTLHLPRYMGEDERLGPEAVVQAATGGTETILLVEDEPSILAMTRILLQILGYNVLTAATPEEAILLVENATTSTIDLLITDVIMPSMNGRDLAALLTARKPSLRCLYMSGYTADVITRQGIVDDQVCFIQKPFSKTDLATKVRQALQCENPKAMR